MTTDQRDADEFAGLAELMEDEQDFSPHRRPDDPARRRRRLRALLVVAVVLALVLLAAGGYSAWALTAPVAAPVEASGPPVAVTGEAVSLALPADGATAISVAGGEAYLGAEASGIWAASGSDEPRPMASITKLITALVILDARPLSDPSDPGPTITFSKAAHDLYDRYYVMGATIAPMPTGSRMTLREALETILIPSASNYADAVSTWVFGSQWGFVNAARAWLDRNGLTRTTVVEPTGMNPANTSTPTDLIALGRLAAANPVVAAITATPAVNVPGAGMLYNTNGLLGTNGITGLKTGNLGGATHNLLYTAQLDVGMAEPLSIIGVRLGGATRAGADSDVRVLLDSIRRGFHHVPVAERGREVGAYSTPWGSRARMVMAADASIFTWSDTPIAVTLKTKTPRAYVDGEVVGTLTWTAGPETVSVDVEIEGTIEQPDAWWRLTHPGALGDG